jgi:hypothetical protein
VADLAALKTYRYLRLGMVVLVVALAAAVALEFRQADCFQDSISAYYYTPARPVFVGVMIAIGVSLIVIKGSTAFEDGCLNAAGMLAPIVAFVPTTDVGTCWSVAPVAFPLSDDGSLAPWVRANVDNNIGALLIAGAVAWVVAVVVHSWESHDWLAVVRRGELGTRIGLGMVFLLLLVGTAALWWWDNFSFDAHGKAAMAMFGFLALASLGNGFADRLGGHRSPHRRWYIGVGIAMPAAGLLLLIGGWQHRVFAVEVIEILLFVTFWLVQSRERWDRTT